MAYDVHRFRLFLQGISWV